MKKRIVYILLYCIGMLLTPVVSSACTPQAKKQTCSSSGTTHHKNSSVQKKHVCCSKNTKVAHSDCRHCSGHTCNCAGSVRTGFDTSLTAGYTISFLGVYWQDLSVLAFADQSRLSSGFYSCWLPPKI